MLYLIDVKGTLVKVRYVPGWRVHVVAFWWRFHRICPMHDTKDFANYKDAETRTRYQIRILYLVVYSIVDYIVKDVLDRPLHFISDIPQHKQKGKLLL